MWGVSSLLVFWLNNYDRHVPLLSASLFDLEVIGASFGAEAAVSLLPHACGCPSEPSEPGEGCVRMALSRAAAKARDRPKYLAWQREGRGARRTASCSKWLWQVHVSC